MTGRHEDVGTTASDFLPISFFPLTLAKSGPEDKLLTLSQSWPAGLSERSDGAAGGACLETFYQDTMISATKPET